MYDRRPSLAARTTILCALLFVPPLPARAQSEPTAEATETPAQAAYRAGVEHFKAKRFEDAVREFNKAYRLDPNPVLVFNMARAFEELKQYEAAIEFYRRYLTMAPDAPDRQTVEDSLRTLEILKGKTAIQPVLLSVVSTPDGAAVFVDGRQVGVTPLKVEVAPGPHFIAVERAGFLRSSEELTLEAGKPIERKLVLVPDAGTTSPAQAEAPSDNTWAWIALGTGGALLAGGGVTGWQAVKKADKLDQIDDDPSIADEDTYDTLRDEGQTYALATDALIVVGGLALGTGLILLLTGDDAPEAPTALAPAPHGFGLSF